MTSVLLAEHDQAVAEMLVRYLGRDGLAVRLTTSPEQALAALADGADAAAVVDLTMPGLDPRHVRQALHAQSLHTRVPPGEGIPVPPGESAPVPHATVPHAVRTQRTPRTPVVFLVAPGPRPGGMNGVGSRLSGAGARRWLVRPFAPRQLVAIIRELVREPLIRAQSSDELASGGLTVGDPPAGPIRLDGGRRLALVGVREVPLTGTEFAVLAVMLAAPGRPRSRGQLLAAAGRSGSDRAADVHIAALRAKIGVPGLIRTVRGAGWSIGESVPRRLS